MGASEMGTALRFGFQNTYARLPDRFFSRVNPVAVAAPRLLKVNADLAQFLRLDAEALATPEGVEVLAGNRVAEGSEPLALAYAGHQFGYFVPQLGDGRANLLGEVVAEDGRRYDLQLKGSGRTPFSRGGDGRAWIGPVLREYLLSEAMAAMGVPTTRALAAVATGEAVHREGAMPGAVLTRVAASHLRVGTFQYFAARNDVEGLRALAEYALARHYPESVGAVKPVRALLEGVIGRHARLVAQWMGLGFVHGVMNTDNTSISGETLDYGPCAFLETYDPETVFSSIDRNGRYAYGNQAAAAQWNLMRLAEALLPLLEHEEGGEEAAVASATAALAGFATQFETARLEVFARKIGLAALRDGDAALVEDLLSVMEAGAADFTLFFRRLCGDGARELFADATAFDAWVVRWRARLGLEEESIEEIAVGMRLVNPAYIPRNHLVEAAIQAALREDLQPFEELLNVATRPFEERVGMERFAAPARSEERVLQTFCGT